MSSLLSAELVATCNALGYYDAARDKYYAEDHTLETVKDLIRYLRRDDKSFEIRRHLGETKVVQTDLLPLLKSYSEEPELFEVLLRLLVNLTSPALMLWQEQVPAEKTERHWYLQIEEHLRTYKQAFADIAVWAILSTRISKILEVEPVERSEEDGLIIERILILIRNVLYIPADVDAEWRPDNDASVHDQVLWSLHQSGILDMILYMMSSENEQAYNLHILEILSYMLREQKASELANAALERSQTEKMRDEAELLAIRHREKNQRQKKTKMYTSTRHSHFGGTFVVKALKSITDNELIYHKPLNTVKTMDLDTEKTQIRTPRNRLPMRSVTMERRSAFSIRLFLKEFCVEILNGAYNTLMHHTKNKLARSRAQQNDESYYLWALTFFMEFNRCHKFEVKLVSETMSVNSFHYVQQQLEKYYDMIASDKKNLRQWSRRLHIALLSYRELLLTLAAMDKSPDQQIRNSSKVIKSNVFYIIEYRELVLTLLVNYDELKMSKSYLKDLLETQHVFLKMLESFCGGKENSVVVQVNRMRRQQKKRAKKIQKEMDEDKENVSLDKMWDEAAPQISVVLEGNLGIPEDAVPFDAASDVPIDDQKREAMVNIQRKLRSFEFENAIGLLRASREVWPDGDFGPAIMSSEEEFTSLKDIFFADLGENDLLKKNKPPENIEEDSDEEDEEEEAESSLQIMETDFKFMDFAKRLLHPKVVKACSLALQEFEKNSALTNHCIIKLLHRIAFDCKMPAMLYQLSIFFTFQKLFEADNCPQYEELIKFAKFVIRQFVKVTEKNEHIFLETLFWKSSKEALDVEEGYDKYGSNTTAAKAWTELEEEELMKLYTEHQEKCLEEDVVDWVSENLINPKNRRAVLKKMREMDLLQNYKGKKPQKSGGLGRAPKQWGIEEESQLRELYEEYKDAMDPLGCIIDRLNVRRPKNRIIEKMLVMGLIQDRKEMRKKRGKKSQGQKDGSESDVSDDDSDNDSRTPKKVSSKVMQASTQKKPRKPKAKGKVKVSSGDLAKMLLELINSGLNDALEWIMESMQDAAEDFENNPDDEEKIPLVPILECALNAMENNEILKLLRAFGIQEPEDEQETYWRIPPTVGPTTLRSHCELIQQALDGVLTIPTDTHDSSTKEAQHNFGKSDSEEEDVFDALRKITNKNVPPAIIPTDSENKNKEAKKSPKVKKMKKLKDERLSLKVTKSSGSNNVFESNETLFSPKPKRNNKKRITVSNSSDDDEGKENHRFEDDNQDGFTFFKPARIDSDDDDEVGNSTQTVRNILDSDDDESNDENERSVEVFKSMKVIPSDDESTNESVKGLKKASMIVSDDENDGEINTRDAVETNNEDQSNEENKIIKKRTFNDTDDDDTDGGLTANEPKKKKLRLIEDSDDD